MKKVLIATTNNDKFDAVSKIFKETIFQDDCFIIDKLTTDMNIPDEKETGDNIERARRKAINAYNRLKEYNYDYIVGLDDAIYIKNRLEPNIKEYINNILFDNYLSNEEEFGFNRAYSIIDRNNNIYETNIYIPYLYYGLKNSFEVKENTYPLSKVSYPLGYNKPICDLDKKEEIDYYLKYSKEKILSLKLKKE